MILLTKDQTATLKSWFLPDRPGSLVGLHVIQTGHGACWVDRWPNPRGVLVNIGNDYSLAGDAEAFTPADLNRHIDGLVETPKSFVPLLRKAFAGLALFDRVVLEMCEKPSLSLPRHQIIRRLCLADTVHVESLCPEIAWISKSWGGSSGLAVSGYTWCAFAERRLVSVACPFLVGERYEDLAVVTEPEYRDVGRSTACAAAVCEDILNRGRQPGWSASAENLASLRVAEKLGFSIQRHDHLYLASTWTESMEKAKHDLAGLIPNGTNFILVDECTWGSEILTGCHAIPFLERDGQFLNVMDNTGESRRMTRPQSENWSGCGGPRPTSSSLHRRPFGGWSTTRGCSDTWARSSAAFCGMTGL